MTYTKQAHGEYMGVTTDYLEMWCPGCDDIHMITVRKSDGSETWQWDGDEEKPTISPSILVNAGNFHPNKPRCHSFLVNGVWQFLQDSTHHLAGQTAEMVPLPDWLAE